ncbi:hypothetical protein CLD22_13025 [Rubrivivax gelatinosus]|nr:hypothetical protein [Rubrivivax gelatinosus]
MESKIKVLGHPLHQMLVVFPLGLLGTSVVFDLIYLIGGNSFAANVSYMLIAAGLIAGAIAAPWGTLDWLAIPSGTRAKAIGALHGGGNLIVLLLFAASWWLRQGDPAHLPSAVAWVVSFCGAAVSMVTAWLGGELVARLGVGVSPHAHLNARSSLDGPAEPATAAEAARARQN